MATPLAAEPFKKSPARCDCHHAGHRDASTGRFPASLETCELAKTDPVRPAWENKELRAVCSDKRARQRCSPIAGEEFLGMGVRFSSLKDGAPDHCGEAVAEGTAERGARSRGEALLLPAHVRDGCS